MCVHLCKNWPHVHSGGSDKLIVGIKYPYDYAGGLDERGWDGDGYAVLAGWVC